MLSLSKFLSENTYYLTAFVQGIFKEFRDSDTIRNSYEHCLGNKSAPMETYHGEQLLKNIFQ